MEKDQLSRKLRRKISFLESLSFQKADLSRKLRNGVVVVIVIIFFLFIYFYYKRGGSSGKSEKGLYNYDRIDNKKRKKGNILARGEGNCMSFPKR